MQKFKLKITRKNGAERIVTVYLDDMTAHLLKETGDAQLLDKYLREEYKASRRARQEVFWTRSLDEDMENGIDYADKYPYDDFSFDNMNDEYLQWAIEQLTQRQQEILRLMYIENKTQKEIAEIYGVEKQAICNSVKRIYVSIQKNYKKKLKKF